MAEVGIKCPLVIELSYFIMFRFMAPVYLMFICDWGLEKQFKSHIRIFEINGFKDSSQHNFPRIVSMFMKFAH